MREVDLEDVQCRARRSGHQLERMLALREDPALPDHLRKCLQLIIAALDDSNELLDSVRWGACATSPHPMKSSSMCGILRCNLPSSEEAQEADEEAVGHGR